MSVRLVTLGGLRGSSDREELTWLGSQWLRTALLTYLALERSATRDSLLATFWPESDGDTAGHRLSQTVYALRRALGDGCIETRGRELRAGERLGADALELERAVADGRHQDAVELYAGPFLAGVHLVDTPVFEGWVDARRARYARLFRLACRSVVDGHATTGDLEAALAVAHAWVVPDPLDDEAQHRLIELLALTGARGEAIRRYEAYVKLLEADGLAPLEPTRELVAGLDRPEAGAPILTPLDTPPVETPSVQEPRGAATDARATPTPAPADATNRNHRARWAWFGAAAAIVALASWALFARGGRAASTGPALGVGILLDAGDPAHDGSLATAFEASLSRHLSDMPGLRLAPTETVSALESSGWPLDSIASALQIDHLVRATVLRSGDSAAVTLALLEGGLRLARAAHLRASLAGDPFAESLGERAAETVRAMVGVHVRERQLGGGTSDSLAIRLRYRAQRQRVLAFQRLHPEHFDLGAATDHLDRADSLLAESQRRDPRWDVPLLERAAQSEPRAALVLSADGADAAGVERAFDEGIAHVDDLLKRNPDHAAALAWRGRLRWQRIGFGRAYTDASVDSAVRDLETALQRDPSLAWAAATLSEIHYTARGDFLEALDWARLAYRHDTYAENLTHTLGRMALSHFELMQEDSATHWCREGLRRDPGNPAPRGCLLEVMAWGTGPALPDAAWIHYDAILDRAAMGNLSELRSYYGMVVAGVIARAGLRDSARAVLARARAGMDPRAEAALLAPELLGLEAAVLFRLDEPESARRRLEEYARRSPRMAELAMARRLLREYVRPPADRPHR